MGALVRAVVIAGDAKGRAVGDAVSALIGAAVIVVNAKERAVGVAVGAFVGTAVIVVDAEGRVVGDAVNAFVGAEVIVVDAEGRSVGDAVGALVGAEFIVVDAKGQAVGDAVGAFVGAAVGDVVRVLAMHTIPLYVAVASDAQSALLKLKNPISFHLGRIDTSIPSQKYDRTMLVMLPWPGNLEPKDGVKL